MLRSLAAHHLLQRMYHFHERFLVFHHYVDVLVRARDFIEHSVVLAALHASGLSCQIGQGEGRTGLLAGHLTPCTVRARAIRFLVTLTPHDIRALAHRTRDDTQVAHTGLDRSFASDPQVLAEVVFLHYVVVMAVDRLFGDAERGRTLTAKHLEYCFQHYAAVFQGIVLRPGNGVYVVIEQLSALRQVCQIAVRQG